MYIIINRKLLWYENYHISLAATDTHEIFIFITSDENIVLTSIYIRISVQLNNKLINMK
jgi:hypothetical protein